MAKFYGEDEELTNLEAKHVSRAEAMFKDVVERFNKVASEMEESINAMESESQKIRNDISSSLVALQFQDRVSQIMTHVSDNIIALSELAEAGVRNLDADTWLGEMKGKFSVDEEHDNLRGKRASVVRPSLLTMF
jgi:methyl-accepting chemotaxis protein